MTKLQADVRMAKLVEDMLQASLPKGWTSEFKFQDAESGGSW